MTALTAAARQGRDGNRLGAQHGRVAASAATPNPLPDSGPQQEQSMTDVEAATPTDPLKVNQSDRDAAAAIDTLKERVASLFDAVAHGDDEHRAWLKQAIADHFDGLPVERPRGLGTKEARVAALEAGLRTLADAGTGYKDSCWQSYSDGYAAARIEFGEMARALLHADGGEG